MFSVILGLQQTEGFVEKVLQLHTAIQHGSNVVLTGPCGSGKTTLYTILSYALNRLHNKMSEATTTEELQPSKSLAGLQKQMPSVSISALLLSILLVKNL